MKEKTEISRDEIQEIVRGKLAGFFVDPSIVTVTGLSVNRRTGNLAVQWSTGEPPKPRGPRKIKSEKE